MRDNWCIGFTDRYTIGVWVGNASGEAMHDVSGVSGAAPDLAGAGAAPAREFAVATLRRRQAASCAHARNSIGGLEPPRPEIFIAGTQASRKGSESQRLRASPFGIASPVDGSLFAIDPDMPPGVAEDHVRRRARHLGARRQAAGDRSIAALVAVAWAARAHAVGSQRQGNPERALRGAGSGRQNREGSGLKSIGVRRALIRCA